VYHSNKQTHDGIGTSTKGFNTRMKKIILLVKVELIMLTYESPFTSSSHEKEKESPHAHVCSPRRAGQGEWSAEI
jgi:hypothetical protein